MLSLSLPPPLLLLLPCFALSLSSSHVSFLPRPLVPSSSLRSRDRIPHSTPLRDPSRSFAPRCPLATSSRPVTRPASRLSFNLKSQLASNHYNRPSITTLHITHYKLPVSLMDYQSRPASLVPPSILSPVNPSVLRISGHARNRRIYQTRD